MNKVTIEITADEGKITAEIDGKTFVNTWYKKSRGIYSTKEKGIEDQIYDSGVDIPEKLCDALMFVDITEFMQGLKELDDFEDDDSEDDLDD
ncbi:MAG: hypothetical protein GT601_05930 [Acidaminobacter sp.]|uniref:hypothetical protein n=1 Tax=Acidaminobacter sp. TaxID=1872102 RepID=UPI00137D4741|nr:hypothetical protein [Acidaminobacter sp.]MZQ97195.1 hypothetical protein [Acidaminobacter sp.]